MSYSPNEPKLLSEDLLLSSIDDVGVIKERVSKITKDSEAEAARIGVELWKQKKYNQALSAFEVLSSRNPKSASTWFNLAVNYNELGEKKKAKEACQKGLSLDPMNPNLLELHNTFQKSE